jgi:hypothetical protein|eukprot:COSAG01_NODE_11650_length_1887_cov_41.725951_1_plen_171_part_00
MSVPVTIGDLRGDHAWTFNGTVRKMSGNLSQLSLCSPTVAGNVRWSLAAGRGATAPPPLPVRRSGATQHSSKVQVVTEIPLQFLSFRLRFLVHDKNLHYIRKSQSDYPRRNVAPPSTAAGGVLELRQGGGDDAGGDAGDDDGGGHDDTSTSPRTSPRTPPPTRAWTSVVD